MGEHTTEAASAGGSASTSGAIDLMVRFLGWGGLGLMVAYLLNNVLTYWFDFPGVGPVFGLGDVGNPPSTFLTIIQIGLYAAALGGALWLAFQAQRALRQEAERIFSANAYLIRGCFWAVVYIGVCDGLITFLYTLDVDEAVLGDGLSRLFLNSAGRGPFLHAPLILLGFVTAAFTKTLGFHWLALLVVVGELGIVTGRFVFTFERTFMADMVRFWYSSLFLFASAHTLLEDGHVRVDVFYADMDDRAKGVVNAVGSLCLGMVLCWTILLIGTWSQASAINAPIYRLEVGQQALGAQLKYLMASLLGVFAVTMLIQFTAMLFEAVADQRGDPGKREKSSEIAH